MTIKSPDFSHVPALRALFAEAFDESDAFLDDFFKIGFSPERALAIFEVEEPVSALYTFDVECQGEKMAYLYAISTRRDMQGKGLARTLIKEAHTRLESLGYSSTILVPASPTLFNYYRRIGYIDACGICEQSYLPSGSSLPLRRIGLNEFLESRRKMLPGCAVVEEGPLAELLANHAEFYTGEGILLTAKRDGSRLFGVELLGNESLAPRILTSLECSEGKFRTIGSSRPFAMYYPLKKNVSIPTHFGITLDV